MVSRVRLVGWSVKKAIVCRITLPSVVRWTKGEDAFIKTILADTKIFWQGNADEFEIWAG